MVHRLGCQTSANPGQQTPQISSVQLPPVSPGQTEGLRVDSKSLAGLGWRSTVTAQVPATRSACPVPPRHVGFPAHMTCTCDALGMCRAPHPCQTCSACVDGPTVREVCILRTAPDSALEMFMAPATSSVNPPKPHCGAKFNKQLFSLPPFCLNFAASLSCIGFSSAPAWKNYSEIPRDGHS